VQIWISSNYPQAAMLAPTAETFREFLERQDFFVFLITVYVGAGLIAIYGGIALASLVARRRGLTAHAPYRMPLFPLPPLVTLAALTVVLWASWLDEEEGRLALIATAAQMLIAWAYYRLVLTRRGWRARLPAEECPS
jgi:L-asparagine transporter-like permease